MSEENVTPTPESAPAEEVKAPTKAPAKAAPKKAAPKAAEPKPEEPKEEVVEEAADPEPEETTVPEQALAEQHRDVAVDAADSAATSAAVASDPEANAGRYFYQTSQYDTNSGESALSVLAFPPHTR